MTSNELGGVQFKVAIPLRQDPLKSFQSNSYRSIYSKYTIKKQILNYHIKIDFSMHYIIAKRKKKNRESLISEDSGIISEVLKNDRIDDSFIHKC